MLSMPHQPPDWDLFCISAHGKMIHCIGSVHTWCPLLAAQVLFNKSAKLTCLAGTKAHSSSKCDCHKRGQGLPCHGSIARPLCQQLGNAWISREAYVVLGTIFLFSWALDLRNPPCLNEKVMTLHLPCISGYWNHFLASSSCHDLYCHKIQWWTIGGRCEDNWMMRKTAELMGTEKVTI